MKVYIRIGKVDYEGEDILGVFASQENADAMPIPPNSCYDSIHTEEWDVTPATQETKRHED